LVQALLDADVDGVVGIDFNKRHKISNIINKNGAYHFEVTASCVGNRFFEWLSEIPDDEIKIETYDIAMTIKSDGEETKFLKVWSNTDESPGSVHPNYGQPKAGNVTLNLKKQRKVFKNETAQNRIRQETNAIVARQLNEDVDSAEGNTIEGERVESLQDELHFRFGEFEEDLLDDDEYINAPPPLSRR